MAMFFFRLKSDKKSTTRKFLLFVTSIIFAAKAILPKSNNGNKKINLSAILFLRLKLKTLAAVKIFSSIKLMILALSEILRTESKSPKIFRPPLSPSL